MCNNAINSVTSARLRVRGMVVACLFVCFEILFAVFGMAQAQVLEIEAKPAEALQAADDEVVRQLLGSASRALDKDRLSEAIETADTALDHIMAKSDPSDDLRFEAFNLLATAHRRAGNFKAASPFYRDALQISEKIFGKNSHWSLVSANNLALFMFDIGQLNEAEEMLRKTLALRMRLHSDRPASIATVSGNLASVLQDMGRYGEAEVLALQTLDQSVDANGRFSSRTATALNNLGHLHLATGRYADALPLFEEAYNIGVVVDGVGHLNTLRTLGNLAGTYRALGDYEEAETILLGLLQANKRGYGPDHPDTITTLSRLSSVLLQVGRFDAAARHAETALDSSLRSHGQMHISTATALTTLADVKLAMNEHAEAVRLNLEALDVYVEFYGDSHPKSVTILERIAGIITGAGLAEQALDFFMIIDQRLNSWLKSESFLAITAERRREILQTNSTNLDRSLSLALREQTLPFKTFAAHLVLRWKKRIAQTDALLASLQNKSDDPEILEASKTVQELRSDLSVAVYRNQPRKIVHLQTALEKAERTLRSLSRRFEEFAAVKNAEYGDVAAALPPSSALVEYKFFNYTNPEANGTSETRLIAILIRPDFEPELYDLGPDTGVLGIPELIADHEARLIEGISFDQVLHYGHGKLVAPILKDLAGVQALYIAPDGPLGTIPFEALKPPDGQLLVEQYVVHMIQTGRDLLKNQDFERGSGLVALGGIDFGDGNTQLAQASGEVSSPLSSILRAARNALGSFDALPASLTEVEAIGQAYFQYRPEEGSPRILFGHHATESIVKESVVRPRVLHFATHGFYLPNGSLTEQPLMQSGIVLAGANKGLSGHTDENRENGILHAVEVQSLDLTGTELVVLSACDTAQGVSDYSEGMEGLPRAFYVAGAKNVLAALWPVDDVAAQQFMTRFYENWLSSPDLTPAQALRETKLSYINGQANLGMEHWAAFVLFEG